VQPGLVLPAHGPLDQLPNVPVDAAANSVTVLPAVKLALHVVPHAIPEGVLVTVPEAPSFWTRVTVTVKVPGAGAVAALKTAVMVRLDEIVVLHVPVPLQPPPLQPAKTDPEAAVAVRVTVVPFSNDREHVDPQLIPLGLLVTVPAPVPVFLIVRVELPPLPLPLSYCGSMSAVNPESLPHPTSRSRPVTNGNV
jgi:hypothetical protein